MRLSINNTKNLRTYIGTIMLAEGYYFKCFSVCREKEDLTLYAEAYDNVTNKLLLDAELDTFRLQVFSIQIEKYRRGVCLDTVEFLTGVLPHTTRAAYGIITKNRELEFDDIEEILEINRIPYVEGIDSMTRTYILRRIKLMNQQDTSGFKKHSFDIKIDPKSPLLKEMFKIKQDRVRLVKYMTSPEGRRRAMIEAAATIQE